MTDQRRKKSDFGILRCTICGDETARVPRGLYYGFPRHCGEVMTVVTERQLQEEREFAERYEEEVQP